MPIPIEIYTVPGKNSKSPRRIRYRQADVAADVLTLSPGARVDWYSREGDFAIVFWGHNTPFRTCALVGRRTTGDELNLTGGKSLRRFGAFPFGVVLLRPEEAPLVDDPIIIIRSRER